MAVDFARSGYRIKMKTGAGLTPVDVVWFRVPDDRPFIRGLSPYRSLNWVDKWWRDWRGGLGEQRPHNPECCQWIGPWYDGHAPAPYLGVNFCGGQDWWEGRLLFPPEIVTGPDGMAPCCEMICPPGTP